MSGRAAFALALGMAVLPVTGCGSGEETISLNNADAGRTVVAAVGDTIEVTLQTIGPGQYGTPSSSSMSVRFLGKSTPPGQPNPGGARQLFRFEAVASGRADIVIPFNGGPPQRPSFAFTVEVS